MANAFWQQQFDGFEPTAFPDLTGLSPTARNELSGVHVEEAVLHDRLQSLETACRKLNVTLLALCQAAWSKVLAAYLGEADVCFGCLESGTREEVVPTRVLLDPQITNQSLVNTLHEHYDEAKSRRAPSAEDVKSLCGADVTKLYDTIVSLTTDEVTTTCTDDHASPALDHDYAVFASIVPLRRKDELRIRLHCRRSLILAKDTHIITSTLKEAFFSVIGDPAAGSRSWRPRISPHLLSLSNQHCKPLDAPFGHLVHAAVESHATSSPDATALDFEDGDGRRTIWSYSQLNSIGDRIAQTLVQDHGLKVEDSVPLCIPKGPAFYACVLGVLKAGGVFTPFSGSPPDRKAFMLKEMASKTVLCTDEEDMSWCSGARVVDVTKLIRLEGLDAAELVPFSSNVDLSGSNLAYQMYTSGSTGRPKAVSIEHRHAVQTTCASRSLVPWKPTDRMLQYAAPSFDMCYYDIFLAWSLGICLCSADNNAIYNDLSGVINRLDVTLLGLTPSVAQTLDPKSVSSLRWLYCIGEAMPQSLVEAWEGKLVNSYGPTEAAQMVTLFPVEQRVKSAIIGKPFANTSFTVIQKDSDVTAPVFALGELCIGGTQVARGYHANEERTQQSFIVRDGHRMYKTGDNVRMLGDGNVEFVGRTDDQVKIRGQRVELGEINSVLKRAHDSITNVSTQILRFSEQSRQQLVAFVVSSGASNQAEQATVRRAAVACAKQHLPAYMIPKTYLFIDRIPLSAAGKVDKRALARTYQEVGTALDTSASASADTEDTEVERLLRRLFSKSSGCPSDQIKQRTSLYHLGLDSINAIQMAGQLKQSGYPVTPSEILGHPTLAGLSSHLSSRSASPGRAFEKHGPHFNFTAFDTEHRGEAVERYKISPAKLDSIRPCSPLQAGMIAQSLHSNGAMYINHLTYKLTDDVDAERLRTALDALLEHYEILRSGFVHLQDSSHTLAMITYRSRAASLPVSFMQKPPADLMSWRKNKTDRMLAYLQDPPWYMLIVPGKLHFSAHHALYDARVLEMIARDLTSAYNGERLPPLPSLELPLALFLQTDSEDQSPSAEFWKRIGGRAVISKFPILTPLHVKDNNYGVASTPCSLSYSQIQSGSRNIGVTVQSLGQAAWARLLSAYLGEDTVTFGTVLSGRNTQESLDVAFPCISTVPTTVHASQSRSLILKGLMKFNADVQQHQFASLKQIHRWTGRLGDALFDTLFTLQLQSTREERQSLIRFLDNELVIDYPVSVEIEPTVDDQLMLRIYYRFDYVPKQQATLMVQQLESLLLDLLSAKGTSNASSVSNADPSLYAIDQPEVVSFKSDCGLLHELVEATVAQTPDKVALEYVTAIDGSCISKRTWSFQDLEHQSNATAHFLNRYAVPQGSIIAVCFDKCPEAALAMLGILKAGCGFLALDPGAPHDRKKFIMEDSKAALLLTKDGAAGHFDCPVEVIDFAEEALRGLPTTPISLDRPVDNQEVAYCLYTSGTTGTPKGCVITHENVVQAMLNFRTLYKYTPESRWLAFASYHFDVSVMEHYWSWSVGVCCVIASRDLIFEDIAGTIRKLGITHIDLTPSLARVLHPDEVPSLANGVFVTGGEMLKQETIEAWGKTGAIHNAYGPTEATIGCTMYRGVPENGRPTNIGTAWPTAGTVVVNPDDPEQVVLRGAVGELCITGKLVAKGYLHRPKLTAERFIDIAGQRTYRTGDLVRILHDGSFDMLGRADDQVKLRGQRLEVGEINAVIKQSSPSILDVSTQLLRHPKQQKEQLVAFVVAEKYQDRHHRPSVGSSTLTSNVLETARSACQDQLPSYMVPTNIVPITSLPLSANNKADGKQLKALYESTAIETIQSFTSDVYQEASDANGSKAEMHRIVDVLARTLRLDPSSVAMSASFFELGVDSISVLGLVRRLKGEGYTRASVSLVMRHASVARLAKAIGLPSHIGDGQAYDGSVQAAKQNIAAIQHRVMSFAASYLSVKRSEIETLAPCTPLQLGIITRSLESARGLYFAAFSFDLDLDVDIGRLEASCRKILEDNQILRTSFLPTDEGYIQVVLRNVELSWKEAGVASSPLADHLDQLRAEWWRDNQTAITRPFEICITRTASKTVLTLHIFHGCYDGNSLPMLMRQFLLEYHGQSQQNYGSSFHDALPFGPLREVPGAKDFWLKHLRYLGSMTVATALRVSDPVEEDFIITARLEPITGFEDCRRTLNVTHQAVIQAAWTAVLQSYCCAPLNVGIVVSGRSIDFDGADHVVGPLFNTIPFLLSTSKSDSIRDIIQQCHDFNTSALPYQHTPLRDIQKWTRKLRPSYQPLFDTLFVFQKDPPSVEEPAAIWTPRDSPYEADYPLSLEVVQIVDGGFDITLGAQAGHSNAHMSQGMLSKFEDVLRLMIAAPEQPLSNLVDMPDPRTTLHNANSNDHLDSHAHGHANGQVNGTKETFSNADAYGRELTADAMRVRDAVAKLADTSAHSIQANTSILELGLDSIDAVKLSSKLRRTAGLDVSVSAIMRNLTVAKIALATTASKQNSATPQANRSGDIKSALKQCLSLSGEDMAAVEDVLPCTPLQEGLVADMINTNFKRYLNHDVLQLDDSVDVEKLQSAWQTVIDATPIMRTRFVEIDDPAVESSIAQVVLKPKKHPWGKDIVATAGDMKNLLPHVRDEIKEAFRDRPPIRLTIVKVDGVARPSHMILSLAHAMYDGWSLGLLHEDVQRAYFDSFAARPACEPALYKILDASKSASGTFWRDALADVKPTRFPATTHGRRNSMQTHRQEIKSHISIKDVQDFCKRNRSTISALTQTVWACTVAFHTKQLDVAFGQILSGRDDEDANEVALPTMNTVISRAVLHGSRAKMVQYMQQYASAITEHQHYPLRKALALADNAGQGGLFNTLFVYQKSPGTGNDDSPKLYKSVGGFSDAEYPVCVEAEIFGDALIWRAACKTECLDGHGTAKLLTTMDLLLHTFVENGDEPTVSFNKGHISICGLEPFTEQDKTHIERALDEIEGGKDELNDDDWSPTEQAIRRVVSQVARVDVDHVNKGSSLLGLGLDSISAIKVASLLRKQGIVISVNQILKAGNVLIIAQVADVQKSQHANGNGMSEVPQTPGPDACHEAMVLPKLLHDYDTGWLADATGVPHAQIRQVLPATAGQVLMLSRWQNQGLFYPTLFFDITGCDDLAHLHRVWEDILSETPILKTIFVATGVVNVPIVQAVLTVSGVIVEVHGDKTLDTAIDEYLPPAIKPPITLFAKRIDDKNLSIAIHLSHALYDGFVLPTLVERLRKRLGSSPTSTEVQSYTYASYLTRTFTSSASRKEYWTTYLRDLRPIALSREPQARKRNVHVVLPHIIKASTLRALEKLARKKHITIQALFLAVYAKVHGDLGTVVQDRTNSDILLGVYTANRSEETTENLLAPTLGFVPLRVRQRGRGFEDYMNTAQYIQQDLADIGDGDRGSIGLWELDAWVKEEGGAGCKVDVWVNLLRSWEEDGGATLTSASDSQPTEDEEDNVRIVGSEHGAREMRRDNINEVQLIDENRNRGLFIKNNAVKDVYQPSIDLEATVHRDGISIGIVAPEELLNLQAGQKVVEELARQLENLAEGADE